MYRKGNIHLKVVVPAMALISTLVACKTPQSLTEVSLPEYHWSEVLVTGDSLEAKEPNNKIHFTEFYQDPLLIELLELGLEENLDLKILAKRLKQAEEQFNLSKKAWLPAVNAGLTPQGMVRPIDNDWSELSTSGSWALDLRIPQWEIDVWGKLNKLKNARYAALLQVELAEKQAKNAIIAQIATSYYELSALRASLKVTEETIENWEQTVATMQALKISGRVTEAAVTQSKAQLAQVKSTLSTLNSSILAQEQRINSLLGRTYQPIRTNVIDSYQKLPIMDVGIPSDLLVQRYDLRIAYEKVKEAFYEKEAAKTYFLPSITLSGNLGFQSTQFKDLFQPIALLGNLVGGLVQPIFQKGMNTARLNMATQEEMAMIYELQDIYINACMEVESLLYSYQLESEKQIYLKEQIEQSQLSVEYTEELLESGFAIYTEVITAKQQLLQAELSGINSFIQKQRLLIQLYNAIGGGI